MSTLEVTLPESLKDFVVGQAAARGYGSPGEYIAALLQEIQKRQAWNNLESLVLDGLASPARVMTTADWEQLRDRIDHIEAQRARS